MRGFRGMKGLYNVGIIVFLFVVDIGLRLSHTRFKKSVYQYTSQLAACSLRCGHPAANIEVAMIFEG